MSKRSSIHRRSLLPLALCAIVLASCGTAPQNPSQAPRTSASPAATYKPDTADATALAGEAISESSVVETREAAAPTIAATVQPTGEAKSVKPAGGAAADVKTAIGAALASIESNGPYRMRVVSTLAESPPAELSVVPPDRARYTANLPDGTHVEVVAIGQKAYVLNPDGGWQVNENEEGGVDAIKPGFGTQEFMNSISEESERAPETVDGIAARAYSFKQTEEGQVVQVMLWVRADNGRAFKIQLAGSEETVTYSIEHDAAVTVQAPAP